MAGVGWREKVMRTEPRSLDIGHALCLVVPVAQCGGRKWTGKGPGEPVLREK